jgi:molybdopterin-binding protein
MLQVAADIDLGVVMKLSARNVLQGKVRDVKSGPVTSQVIVDIGGNNTVTSTITTDAVKDLALEKGKAVHVIIKASEVILGAD